MATFFMLGKYSSEALKGVSAVRTDKALKLIKKFCGEVKSIILTFPDMEKAIQASVALNKLTGISFTTLPAVTVEEFDKLMAKV
jgi:uncharacterized protein with GYD domain